MTVMYSRFSNISFLAFSKLAILLTLLLRGVRKVDCFTFSYTTVSPKVLWMEQN